MEMGFSVASDYKLLIIQGLFTNAKDLERFI